MGDFSDQKRSMTTQMTIGVYSEGVLIAIQPRWCELIAEGKKLIEVRKTYPKKYSGEFKCFIYCTKGKTELHSGKVIGEFACHSIDTYDYNDDGYGLKDERKLLGLSCLTSKELYHYLQGTKAYGWNISDLVIYDKPRELSEFGVSGGDGLKALTRPSQSWCYVTEMKANKRSE